jgi:hypothetical protein
MGKIPLNMAPCKYTRKVLLVLYVSPSPELLGCSLNAKAPRPVIGGDR